MNTFFKDPLVRNVALSLLVSFVTFAAFAYAHEAAKVDLYRLNVLRIEGSEYHAYTMDYNLSADDCIEALGKLSSGACERM
jgi:hypothetical protein